MSRNALWIRILLSTCGVLIYVNEPIERLAVEMLPREDVDLRVNILLIQSRNGVISSYSMQSAERYSSMQ